MFSSYRHTLFVCIVFSMLNFTQQHSDSCLVQQANCLCICAMCKQSRYKAEKSVFLVLCVVHILNGLLIDEHMFSFSFNSLFFCFKSRKCSLLFSNFNRCRSLLCHHTKDFMLVECCVSDMCCGSIGTNIICAQRVFQSANRIFIFILFSILFTSRLGWYASFTVTLMRMYVPKADFFASICWLGRLHTRDLHEFKEEKKEPYEKKRRKSITRVQAK